MLSQTSSARSPPLKISSRRGSEREERAEMTDSSQHISSPDLVKQLPHMKCSRTLYSGYTLYNYSKTIFPSPLLHFFGHVVLHW